MRQLTAIMQLLRVDVLAVTNARVSSSRRMTQTAALRERITRDGRIVTENSEEKEFNILEATQVSEFAWWTAARPHLPTHPLLTNPLLTRFAFVRSFARSSSSNQRSPRRSARRCRTASRRSRRRLRSPLGTSINSRLGFLE